MAPPTQQQQKIDEMFAKCAEIQKQNEELKKQMEEIKNAKNTQNEKADKNALNQAKEKVPELKDQKSFPDFNYYV